MNNQFYKNIASKLAEKNKPGFSERQQHRQTLWHLPKIILVPVMPFVIYYLLIHFMIGVGIILGIEHQSSTNGIPEFLFLIPLFFPAVGIAIIVINLILFSIPAARRAFEKEAKHELSLSFTRATKPVAVVTLKYLIPIGFGISFIGLYLMTLSK